MSATAVAGAEGFSVFPSSDDEESSNIADLSAMFPTLDHDIILTVLQSHHGRLDAAVDYLMAASSVGGDGHTPSQSGIETMYPAHDMEGRYSEDIGGLPEVVPTFEYDNEDDETETDEESTSSLDSSPEPDNNVLDEDDPLPTYEEACMGTDALPMATYILDDQPSEEAVVQTRSEASGGGSEELQKAEHSSDEVKSKESAHKHQKKKGKRKKLKKLAKKMSMKKSSSTEHKRVPKPSSYQRFTDGMDMEGMYKLQEEAEDSNS